MEKNGPIPFSVKYDEAFQGLTSRSVCDTIEVYDEERREFKLNFNLRVKMGDIVKNKGVVCVVVPQKYDTLTMMTVKNKTQGEMQRYSVKRVVDSRISNGFMFSFLIGEFVPGNVDMDDAYELELKEGKPKIWTLNGIEIIM